MSNLLETKNKVVNLGIAKVNKSLSARLTLGFVAGAMISFGNMAYIKSVGILPDGIGLLIGASLFPVGLIIILLAGGELITGNMMVVGTSYLNKKVSLSAMWRNWFSITFANFIGAAFVAFISIYLGFFNGIEETLIQASQSKIAFSAGQIFISGIMCNWFVGLSVWLNVAIKDGIGKIIGIWFPVMVFVYLGFQHSVANTYLLLSAKFLSDISGGQIFQNLVLSYLGNIVGAMILVAGIYTVASKN